MRIEVCKAIPKEAKVICEGILSDWLYLYVKTPTKNYRLCFLENPKEITKEKENKFRLIFKDGMEAQLEVMQDKIRIEIETGGE